MGSSLDVVPTLWASYAIFGCRGLSDGVHLLTDNGKIVTVYALYGLNDNDKIVTVYALYG